MRFFLSGTVLALSVAVMSYPIESSSANLSCGLTSIGNFTYNFIPPPIQDPVTSSPTGSIWSSYYSGGLVFFILSVFGVVWKHYRKEIIVASICIFNNFWNILSRKQSRPVIIAYSNDTLNAMPQMAEIDCPRPVIYNPNRIPLYRPIYIPNPRNARKQYRTHMQSTEPAYRAPACRAPIPWTNHISAFEEDVEMDAFESDGWSSCNL